VVGAAVALTLAAALYLSKAAKQPSAQLVDAVAAMDRRPICGRIVGFPYRPFRAGGVALNETGALRLRSVASDVLAGRDRTRRSIREKAIATLFAGRTDDARKQLHAAVTAAQRDGEVWSDYAAVLLQVGRNGDVLALVDALAAADRAMHYAPRLPEAAFNYALILEELRLDDAATFAYQRFLKLDPSSEWSVEARSRIRTLRKPTRSARWDQVKAAFAEANVDIPDARTMARICEQYSQEARGTVEVNVLGDWAVATGANDAGKAEVKLQTARAVAKTIADAKRDTLLAESVAAIDRAAPATRAELARAHRLYREARLLQHERQPVRARPMFEEAHRLFEAGHSPMAEVVEYWIVNCFSDGPGFAAAMARMRAAVPRVSPRYRNLRGLWAWQEATMFSRIGMHNEALAAYERALSIFDALGEADNRSYMMNAVAFTNASLGRSSEAWRMRRELFCLASEAGKPELEQSVVDAAARSEMMAGNLDRAHALFAVAAATAGPNARLHFDSTLWQALTAQRLGWQLEAASALPSARFAAEKISDRSLRAAVDDDMRFAEAMLVDDAHQRTSMLSGYIAGIVARTDTIHLPAAYVERGRAQETCGNLAAAQQDLVRALSEIEARGEGVVAPDFRDRYFAKTDDIICDLVDVLDRSGNPLAALAANERWRARMTDESVAVPDDFRTVLRGLPTGVTVIEYVSLPDRLLIFRMTQEGVTSQRVAIGREELRERVAQFANEVKRGQINRTLAAKLHEILGHPRGPYVVIVSDPVLDGVPFGALIDPIAAEYVIQKSMLVFAPSATAFLRSLQSRRPMPSRPRALIAGNPSFDPEVFRLEPLPASEREAIRIASLYGVTPLTGAAATKEQVVRELEHADVVHIGSHALAGGDDPQRSCLVLASSGGATGALYVHELVRLHLHDVRVAVVAGCRTANASDAAGGLRNIALALHAAGAANAIGSLWDFDDTAGVPVFSELHRRLLSGATPAAALQATQQWLLHSPDERLRSPSVWASLRLYGTGL
jgi:CHAT domain-containing protein/tetratricopeptide (TPR) repeat protein